jgi:alpha-ketoglutarate-dependent taurine dioxygenase
VFAFRETLQVRFLRLYIEKGHEMAGMPLTEQDVAALNYLGEVARRPALTVAMDLQRGDIQLLNNIFLLHSREQYEDYPEPERKRHYVRIWLVRGPEPGDS